MMNPAELANIARYVKFFREHLHDYLDLADGYPECPLRRPVSA